MAIATSGITTWNNDGTGTWQDSGSGGNSGTNNNVFFTSTGSRARKISNGIKGFQYQVNAAGQDLSDAVICIRWAVLAGVGSLNSRTSGGVSYVIQDTSGNISYWDIDGNDTYGGGWKVSVVDMNTTPSRNNGTNATLTAVEYVGLEWDETASVGGGDPNCYIDQILSWSATNGIGITGNSTSLFEDLVDTADSSQGIWERRGGIIFSKAYLDFQPDATGMSESDATLVFENPVYDAGATIDSALGTIGFESSDADDITLTRCTLSSAGPDETVTTDGTRVMNISGHTGVFTLDTCSVNGFEGTMGLGDSGHSYDTTNFLGCAEITDTGAVFRDCVFRNGVAAAGMYEWDESTDMQDCSFFGNGTGHSVHFTHNSGTDLTGGSAIALTNINFNGGGGNDTATSDIDMNPDTSSINVDFNIVGGNTPTLDQRSPYTGTATAVQTVTVQVTCQEADGTAIQNARVRLEADAGGDLPSDDVVTITTSGTTATVTHTNHGLATNDFVIIRGANEVELTGRNQITVTGANTYTYTITSIGGASGTGTITATSSIISEFTSASGVADNTGFVYTNPQPVRGVARKGTASPYFKNAPISGSISSTGLDVTITMTPDE